MNDEAEELARWVCDTDLWRNFRDSESARYTRGSRAAFHLIVATSVVAVVLVGLIVGINSFVLGGTFAEAVSPSIAVLGIASICVAVGALTLAVRRQKDAAFSRETGEVVIRTTGVALNGVGFEWTLDGRSPRLLACRRASVSGRVGSSFDVIDFESRIEVPSRRTPLVDVVHLRVPIPVDRIAKADSVILRLNSLAQGMARSNEVE
ncbi:MAG TPA: hypothetical protein VGO43_10280 [Pyrinomonadaceae bacterium]|jgi:uncharacterized membrane protein YhaH (DUF805 family)|nr:hypothetical protein [Pyrinomonadaceae bacterium]